VLYLRLLDTIGLFSATSYGLLSVGLNIAMVSPGPFLHDQVRGLMM
jgi:hypothetical protein